MKPPRQRWLVVGLTVAILTCALVAGFRRDGSGESAAPPARVPVLGPRALTIVPGVHLLGGLVPAAAYVVETSAGLVLIDSGLDNDAATLRREMSTLGLDWHQLRAIFLTHVHADHSNGAQYLRDATGAKIYAGQGDAAVLRAGTPREAFFSNFYHPDDVPSRTTVDVELAADQTIAVGDVRFQALATPGHTPGSMCYLMERGPLRALFSGDVIMMLRGDEPSRGLLARPLGTYSAYLSPRYRGDAKAFLATLRRLRELPAPQLVLPGHPRMDPTPQEPTMTPERWQALLDTGIRDLEQLEARYHRDGASFLDGVPKQLLPGLYYLGDLGETALYGFFVGPKFFLIDAPGSGLMELVSRRFHQLGVAPATPTAVLLTSCGPEATAGLVDLIEKTQAQVVAASAGVDSIRERCQAGTKISSGEELPGSGWFRVKAFALRGRGAAPAAYQVTWGEKTVLFSGRLPIKPSVPAASALLRDLAPGRGNGYEYLASLQQLRDVQPDLWLPAVPVDGQNANLYPGDWEDVLLRNVNLLRR